MSLLHPTPGEVIDRLSIVELKIEAYEKAGKNTATLETEKRELQHYLTLFNSTPETESLRNRLTSINQTIWVAEDEVRSWKDQAQLCEVALTIARFNDYRSKVIREIDRACGVETIEEKIYG